MANEIKNENLDNFDNENFEEEGSGGLTKLMAFGLGALGAGTVVAVDRVVIPVTKKIGGGVMGLFGRIRKKEEPESETEEKKEDQEEKEEKKEKAKKK